MPSPRCTIDRWGCGSGSSGSGSGSTTNNNIPKTQEAKAMEDKLKAMMAERDKIDALWSTLKPKDTPK